MVPGMLAEILRQERCPGFISGLAAARARLPRMAGINAAPEKKIFAGPDGKNPSETVAAADMARLRRQILPAVKKEVFASGLPYVSLAYYPAGYRTIGSFRVDCDAAGPEALLGLAAKSRGHGFPFTWFIDAGAQERCLKDIAALRDSGQDIQLHCCRHETYPDYASNKANITRALELMNSAGLRPKGFASPYGKWNPALNAALEELGFDYSSEFAAGYDCLPFYPDAGGRRSAVLQLPAHPICIGSLRKAGCGEEQMADYFERVIAAKYARREPIILYGHPQNELDSFPRAADAIFSGLKRPGVWLATFSEYFGWWSKRLAAKFDVSVGRETLRVITDNGDKSLRLHLETERDGAFLPLAAGEYNLSRLNWSRKPASMPALMTGIGEVPASRAGKSLLRIISRARRMAHTG